MATIKSLPTDVVKKILSYLSGRDEFSACEALPSFDFASDLQLEVTTDFRIREGKRILMVVASELDCKSSLCAALIYYKEVHLVLSRSMVETNSCDQAYFLRRYLEEITGDGTAPFASIELIGKMTSCGCGFACLPR